MVWPWLVPLTYALSLTATALAWGIARRHVEHRPIAMLLSLGLASDVGRRLLNIAVLSTPGPYAGTARVAYHIEQALYLAWLAGVTATSLRLFIPRRPLWPI